MLKKLAPSVLLVIALTLGASSCVASNVKQAKFQSELKSKGNLTPAQATCVTSKIYGDKTISQSDINKLYTSATADQIPKALQAKWNKAIATCITK